MREEIEELIEASMDIPDDVEGSVLVLQVIPERLPLDLGRLYFFRRMQHVNMAKSFTLQIPQGPAQLLRLLANDVWPEIRGPGRFRFRSWQSFSGRSKTIATGRQWILPRQRHDRLARFRLHVGRVDDHQFPGGQPL